METFTYGAGADSLQFQGVIEGELIVEGGGAQTITYSSPSTQERVTVTFTYDEELRVWTLSSPLTDDELYARDFDIKRYSEDDEDTTVASDILSVPERFILVAYMNSRGGLEILV